MNRKPSEQAARFPRRQSDLLALDLDLQRSKHPNQHRGKPNRARAQGLAD